MFDNLGFLQDEIEYTSDVGSKILPDSVIMKTVDHVSPEDLENIAIQYMGIKHTEIQTLKAAERENISMFKFRIVEMWRNRNPGPDVNWRLYRILTGSGRVSIDACQPIIAHSKYFRQEVGVSLLRPVSQS